MESGEGGRHVQVIAMPVSWLEDKTCYGQDCMCFCVCVCGWGRVCFSGEADHIAICKLGSE